ncbi:ABC transporter G family protein [Basidiobolus meristosporus CBS 931.73]|uniref:ABC transporter G family protein n=1 Tax=Basidiobolus meristosporus CBS 931.73 TaxID=1314790 RepID=A0A1Y1WNT2_9FUNG|nr:ABC transporter G family protein [Basidiobolus meristosporus CBS 931.73]|eukprot:ORX75152.1 ABC transporter G family protein [Basidiobolus meristosporus CBS 931.73]
MFHDLERRISRISSKHSQEASRQLSRRSTRPIDPEKGAPQGDDFDFKDYLESGVRAADANGVRRQHMGITFRNLTIVGEGSDASVILTLLSPIRAVGKMLNPMRWFGKISKVTQFDIIHNVTGYCPEGEMLLVLGRPGAGCSSLLRVLANSRQGFLDVVGEVNYGGIPAERFGKYLGEAIYCMEEDAHYPELTVKETLGFALKMKTPARRVPGMSSKEFQADFMSTLLKIFGLKKQENTLVGNAWVRGLSGGERKRMTISEAMTARSAITTWDCPTRGLDAASALDYNKSLRIQCNTLNKTTIATLYQASDSIYDLYDKVMLLYLGRCIFFGPKERAKSYFMEMGYSCEPRKSVPDFLTGITNPNERVVTPGYEGKVPRSPEEFEKYFQQSEDYKILLQNMADYEAKIEREQPAAEFKAYVQEIKQKGVSPNSVYSANFYQQVVALTTRQLQILWGDKHALYERYFSVLIQALVYGSVFYMMGLNSTGAFQRGGALLSSLLFNAFLSQAELPNVLAGRMTLQKHKSYAMYHPSAFHIARVVTDIPIVFVQCLMYSIIAYFMFGLDLDAGKFFIFLLVNILTTLATTDLFRLLGNCSPSIFVAFQLTGICLITLITYCGFSIPYRKMHPWLYWLYWIDPYAYAFKALFVNEMRGLQFPCIAPVGLAPSGPSYNDPAHQVCVLAGAKPGQLSVTGGDYLYATYGYKTSQLAIDIIAVLLFWLFFVGCNMLAMEKIHWVTGGFVKKVFKRGKAPSHSDEEELKRVREAQEAYDSMGDHFAAEAGIFTWDNVNYTVPTKGGSLQLLNQCEGWIKPGQMTALMGSSGAGKTTLLDVLAKRKTIGVVEGDIFLNGNPLQVDFERITGYVEQMDVHNPFLTVREALQFSAKMRQPMDVPLEEKYEYVETVLKMMEMQHLGDALIGMLEAGQGISVEERKRLTIGMELVAKPTILFLDEPTSGLDSQSSYNIIKFIRKLADSGMALVCTIHQPSSILFEHFDRLLLLARGGKVAYFGDIGENSAVMNEYFERNGARRCEQSENPAEYILEVIGAGITGKALKEWTEVWKSSPEAQEVKNELRRLNANASSNVKDPNAREFATNLPYQIWEVYKRINLVWWRDPYFNNGRIGQAFFIGILNGFTFWKLSPTPSDLQLRTLIVFQILILGLTLIFSIQPQFMAQRDFFRRDYASKYYGFFAFAFAMILVEVPYMCVAGAFGFLPLYWTAGIQTTALDGFYLYILLIIFLLFSISFGLAIAAMLQTMAQASIVTPIPNTFLFLFAGLLSPPAAMVYFWRVWMYPLDPYHYFLEGFIATIFNNMKVNCIPQDYVRYTPPVGQTCGSYSAAWLNTTTGYLRNPLATDVCEYCQYSSGSEFLLNFEWTISHRWRNFGILWGYFVFNVLVFILFVWINRKPKR